MDIKKTRTTPLHPQWVERYNQTSKIQLSLFVEDQKREKKYVPLLLMAYRNAIHNPTNFSPARLVMGHEIRSPIELIYGRLNYETGETYSSYVQELQKNMESANEFARTNL